MFSKCQILCILYLYQNLSRLFWYLCSVHQNGLYSFKTSHDLFKLNLWTDFHPEVSKEATLNSLITVEGFSPNWLVNMSRIERRWEWSACKKSFWLEWVARKRPTVKNNNKWHWQTWSNFRFCPFSSNPDFLWKAQICLEKTWIELEKIFHKIVIWRTRQIGNTANLNNSTLFALDRPWKKNYK